MELDHKISRFLGAFRTGRMPQCEGDTSGSFPTKNVSRSIFRLRQAPSQMSEAATHTYGFQKKKKKKTSEIWENMWACGFPILTALFPALWRQDRSSYSRENEATDDYKHIPYVTQKNPLLQNFSFQAHLFRFFKARKISLKMRPYDNVWESVVPALQRRQRAVKKIGYLTLPQRERPNWLD